MTISVDLAEVAAAFRAGLGARWTFRAIPPVSDRGAWGCAKRGAPAWVAFVRAPPAVQLVFDDLAVQEARRQVLAGPPSALVTTVLTDASHCEAPSRHGATGEFTKIPSRGSSPSGVCR